MYYPSMANDLEPLSQTLCKDFQTAAHEKPLPEVDHALPLSTIEFSQVTLAFLQRYVEDASTLDNGECRLSGKPKRASPCMRQGPLGCIGLQLCKQVL